ncbi:MAG TPA: CapA family protein [Gemmatimonadaceae bacterium]|nr:CapA family protein [Gemmatimonadaceae bacterium]
MSGHPSGVHDGRTTSAESIAQQTVPNERWESPEPRFFAQPYTFVEGVSWIVNNLFGPSVKDRELTSFIPRRSWLNLITRRITLGFMGDIMPFREVDLQVNAGLKEFFSDVDYLVGNFEGTLISGRTKRVLLGQAHTDRTVAALAALFPPERTVLSCANNHAADFGFDAFSRSYERLKESGFRTIGRGDEPAIRLGEINIATGTMWSNQRCGYISRFENLGSSYTEDAAFNILFPHWGFELRLYPPASQIESGERLLKQWDMIVGHHSHSPQPVASYEIGRRRKLLAYSLGNLTFGLRLGKYLHGIVLKVTAGPGPEGDWCVGDVQWSFTTVTFPDKARAELDLVAKCPYFDD